MTPDPDFIRQGIDFLRSQQCANGRFGNQSSPRIGFRDAHERESIFFTALVLDILAGFEVSPEVEQMRARAAAYLESQASQQLTFNYWERGSGDFGQLPYPDDLDDTVCALAALHRHDPAWLTGERLGKLARMLIAVETAEGGPYRTWLVADGAGEPWTDTDAVVNANVLRLMALLDIELPAVTAYVDEHIKTGSFHSPYYFSPVGSAYMISRGYRGPSRGLLVDWLGRAAQNQHWGNPLESALALAALLNLGVEPRSLTIPFARLWRSFARAGRPYPFVPFNMPANGRTRRHYGGSAALTMALWLDVALRMTNADGRPGAAVAAALAPRPAKSEPGGQVGARQGRRLTRLVVSQVKRRLERVGPELAQTAAKLIDDMVKHDTSQQIALGPWHLVQALNEHDRQRIPEHAVVAAGASNLFGWLAYTIYDDFMDGEGNPVLLPVANICLRELVNVYAELGANPEFMDFLHETMDRVDLANFCEVRYCHDSGAAGGRFWAIHNSLELAEKSIGHAISLVYILNRLGHAIDSPEVQHLLAYVQHTLAARQLSDDMHDWEADQRNNIITKVVADILADHQAAASGTSHQQTFWFTTVERECTDILRLLDLAGSALRQIGVIARPDVIEQQAKEIRAAAQQTITARREVLAFMRAF